MPAPHVIPRPDTTPLTDAQVHRLRELVIAIARGCEIYPESVDFISATLPSALVELGHRRALDARLGCAVTRARRAA